MASDYFSFEHEGLGQSVLQIRSSLMPAPAVLLYPMIFGGMAVVAIYQLAAHGIAWQYLLALGLGLLVGVPSLRTLITDLRIGRRVLNVYSDGFTHTNQGATKVYKWDEIESIWRGQTDHYKRSYGVTTKTGTSWIYTFLRGDGTQLTVFSGKFPHFNQFVEIVDREVIPRLAKKAIATFEAGQPVDFGDIAIRRDGISKDDEQLGWYDIGAVDIANGRVCVRKRGQSKPWYDAEMYDVENGPVMAALLRYMGR
jgi:hypothetical protein